MLIPLKTCNKAADVLIDWFSNPDELRKIAGGKKWWQVRGLDGVDGEWVTERSFLKNGKAAEAIKKKEEEQGRTLTELEADIVRMDGLETTMVSCPCLDAHFRAEGTMLSI